MNAVHYVHKVSENLDTTRNIMFRMNIIEYPTYTHQPRFHGCLDIFSIQQMENLPKKVQISR